VKAKDAREYGPVRLVALLAPWVFSLTTLSALFPAGCIRIIAKAVAKTFGNKETSPKKAGVKSPIQLPPAGTVISLSQSPGINEVQMEGNPFIALASTFLSTKDQILLIPFRIFDCLPRNSGSLSEYCIENSLAHKTKLSALSLYLFVHRVYGYCSDFRPQSPVRKSKPGLSLTIDRGPWPFP
jgi:hypothetical protein